MLSWVLWGLVVFGLLANVGLLMMQRASQAREALIAQIGPDRALIESLRDAGSDLTKPHVIRFGLQLPSEELARTIAAGLEADGYHTNIEKASLGASWLCHATRTMVPDAPALTTAREQFTRLAGEHHGAYDGWEAPVTR
jgi:hypothetical protein